MKIDKYLAPFRPMRPERDIFRDMRQEMNRLFDHYDLSTPLSGRLDLDNENEISVQPKLDVKESENGLEIVVDVPGVKEEDITIQLEGNSLSVKGDRSSEKTEEKKSYKVVERSSGSFMRSIVLPFEPDSSAVKADLDAGVLTIMVPRPANVADHVKTISLNKSENSRAKKSAKKTQNKDAEPA